MGPIVLGRELRQGDPLSPYLFILCAEGLSSLIEAIENRGKIHGCKVSRGTPIISHLLFADDSFLLFRATGDESSSIRRVLLTYEMISGQVVNFQKSSIFFRPNVDSLVKNTILVVLGVSSSIDTGRYIGLPSLIGESK